MTRPLFACAIVFCAFASFEGQALAQTRESEIGLSAGSGLSLGGTGSADVASHRTPLFLDLSARTSVDEAPTLAWGGSLRLELEGRTSVGIVPRFEVERGLGPIALRPQFGIPFFFAPFTLLGVEAGLCARFPKSGALAVHGSLLVDAYPFGSDVPKGSALTMVNLLFGVLFDV